MRGMPDQEGDPVTDQPAHQMPAGVRPRRDPAATAPKITEADRPDPAELARIREQLQRHRRLPPRGQ